MHQCDRPGYPSAPASAAAVSTTVAAPALANGSASPSSATVGPWVGHDEKAAVVANDEKAAAVAIAARAAAAAIEAAAARSPGRALAAASAAAPAVIAISPATPAVPERAGLRPSAAGAGFGGSWAQGSAEAAAVARSVARSGSIPTASRSAGPMRRAARQPLGGGTGTGSKPGFFGVRGTGGVLLGASVTPPVAGKVAGVVAAAAPLNAGGWPSSPSAGGLGGGGGRRATETFPAKGLALNLSSAHSAAACIPMLPGRSPQLRGAYPSSASPQLRPAASPSGLQQPRRLSRLSLPQPGRRWGAPPVGVGAGPAPAPVKPAAALAIDGSGPSRAAPVGRHRGSPTAGERG